jgi:hypothetical protein
MFGTLPSEGFIHKEDALCACFGSIEKIEFLCTTFRFGCTSQHELTVCVSVCVSVCSGGSGTVR